MFNICPECGEYSDDKTISSDGKLAICKSCGHGHPFLRLPLLIVTGASGTGKSTLALKLISEQKSCVFLDSDILWSDAFNNPDDDFKAYRNLWLRMAKNISQNGRPVVLFGSSTPGQFEQCVESRYFSGIHYLALVCERDELIRRLKARPNWRKSGSDSVIDAMVKFNQWLIEHAASTKPSMTLLDTGSSTLAESAEAVTNWISSTLNQSLA